MSAIVSALVTRNPKSTGVLHLEVLALTFDQLVASFSDDLVHYWKFQVPAGTTVTDEQGLTNATITGSPQRGIPTLVLGDTISEGAESEGTVIAWPGTTGEFAQAAHNAAQKTSSGTIIVYAQFDTLNQKSQLVMGDASSAAGGFAFGVNPNGAADGHLRGVGGTPSTVSGSAAGDIQLNRAYCFIFKWGGSGLELVIFNDVGTRIRRATNPSMTSGLSGTSAIRFGATHTDTNHHDGPYGRVIWINRSISSVEEDLFGQRTKANLGTYRSLEQALSPMALWGMGDGTGASVLRDLIGARNGSYIGSVTSASDLPVGVTDSAANLGAVASGFVSHDSGLALSAFTLSFWFKPNSMLQGTNPTFFALLDKDSGLTNTAGDFKALYHEDGWFRVTFQDGTLNHTWDSAVGSVIINSRRHVSIRASAAGVDVRLDGQSLPKVTNLGVLYSGAWSSNTQPLRFGRSVVTEEGIADAVLDEVALYSRVLTDDDVLDLAQHTAVAPVAVADVQEVPESDVTPLDVVANDQFVGSKAALTVQIMSQPAGGDSVAVDGNNDIVYTSGAVGSDTLRTFTYRITDANGTSNTATCSVTVINAVAPSADLPFFGQFYGGGWPSRSNGEWELRSQPFTWFFRAERSGTIDRIRWHWRNQSPPDPSGYSAGTGGVYTIEVRTGNPNNNQEAAGSALIASIAGIAPGNPTGSNGRFLEYTFTNTGALVAGNPYVVKVTNTHANAANNYVSQNTISVLGWSHNTNPPFYTEPAGGGAVGSINVAPATGSVRGNAVGAAGGTIKRVLGYSPHMIEAGANDYMLYPMPVTGVGGDLRYDRFGPAHISLRYTDGIYTLWGVGSGEYPESRVLVAGTTQVRQRFRVTRASRTVSGVFVLGWVSNTAGSLNVVLEQGPQNDDHTPNNAAATVLETVSVPANMFLNAGSANAQFNQNNSGLDDGPLDLIHYVWVPFNVNRTLTLGQTYNLRLAPNGCNFYIFGSNRSDQQFAPSGRTTATWSQWATARRVSWTEFEDSRGPQVSTNSGAAWSYWPASHQQIPITFKCV